MIGTLAVDGLAVTFGTAKEAWVGCGPAYIYIVTHQRQCTNFILLVALKPTCTVITFAL